MAKFTAKEVQALRQATGAGMVDAKNALTEADGNYDAAVEILRVSGLAKAAKRSDREASNGVVAAAGNSLIVLRCETDFVAKNEQFTTLATKIAQAVEEAKVDGLEAAGKVEVDGKPAADVVAELGATIGEKLELGNAARFDGTTHAYLHIKSTDLPPQVGVLLEYTGPEAQAHKVALQVAAMSPEYLSREDVPEDVVAKERSIAEATAKEEGKPEAALPKIVEGRLNGFFKENCLLEQPSVSEDKKTVAKQLEDAGVTITRFVRFATGS